MYIIVNSEKLDIFSSKIKTRMPTLATIIQHSIGNSNQSN